MIKEYSEASAFILPSREDCFGLVLLEAMCAKMPIIASKFADGVYDIVQDGVNGYIVNPYDEKELGTAIYNALNDRYMSEQAKKNDVEKFEFSTVSKAYVDAIRYAEKS